MTTAIKYADAHTTTKVWDSFAVFDGIGTVQVSTIKLPADRISRGRFETAILWDEHRAGGEGYLVYDTASTVDDAAEAHTLARDFALAEIRNNIDIVRREHS